MARRSRHPLGSSRSEAPAISFERLEPRALLAAVSWVGGGGNDLWSNPLNWSGGQVPAFADDVTIVVDNVQRRVVADAGPIRVRSLTLDETLIVNSGVTLNVTQAFDVTTNADLRINGLINWVQGTWESSGPIRLQPGGQLNIGSSLTPELGSVTLRTTLDNRARLAWRGGSIQVASTGAIINNLGKRFDISAPNEMIPELGQVGSLTNSGVLRRGGAADKISLIDINFTNAVGAQVTVLRGTLAIGTEIDDTQRTVTNAGRVYVDTGAIEFLNDATHEGARFTGGEVGFYAGVHRFVGTTVFGAGDAAVRYDGSVQIPVGSTTFRGTLRLFQRPIEVAGTLAVEGLLFLAGGPTNDRLPVTGAGTINVSGQLYGANLDLRTPVNLGVSGQLRLVNAGQGNSTRLRSVITNSGTIEIAAGELWTDGGGRVDSTSLIRKTESTTVVWSVPLQLLLPGPGTPEIEVLAGRLRIQTEGADLASPGVIDVQGGTLKLELGAGTFINTGTIIVDSDAEMEVTGNMTTSGIVRSVIKAEDFGAITVSGTLTIDGGTLRASFIGEGFAAGQQRAVLTAASRVGTFTNFSRTGLPPSLTIQTQYNATSVVVLIVPA